MKIEFRFLILTASILLGCFVGIAYFNHGDSFPDGVSRLDENENPYNSAFDRNNSAEKSLKDEIRQQLASTRTLYEFTATSEQIKTENPAEPDLEKQMAQKETAQEPSAQDPIASDSSALESAEASELASLEADSEMMGEVLAKMAQNSPDLTDSLNALNEARKDPADKLAQRTSGSMEIAESKPKALIDVRDYTQTTPILNVNPVEDLVEFQVQGAAEAQNSLSQELLAQNQAPAQNSAPAQIPEWALGADAIQRTAPLETPVVAQGTAPIQTFVPIQLSAPIQTSAPIESPELVQTSALVQTPTVVGSPAQAPLLPAARDDFDQASSNQAIGSLAPIPAQTPNSAPEPLLAIENPDDLDQNPLAAIMGLSSPEKAAENETAKDAIENPAVAPGTSAQETPASASAQETPAGSSTQETPAGTSAQETPAGASAEKTSTGVSVQEASTGASAQEPLTGVSSEGSVGSPVETLTGSPSGSPAKTSAASPNETTAETLSAPPKQIAENPFSHQPTRIKKPDRNPVDSQAGKEAAAPISKEEYSLDFYRVNLRKALASFQIETGLKVVASLDVQGTVSCKSKNADPEVLLASLLADTQFKFVRNGNFVYIAPANQLTALPTPLEKTETQFFVPKFISLEELELVFKSNLSQFGTCEVIRDPSGQKGLSVTDWVLSLEQLEKIQQIVDVPAPEELMNAFVFQRELDGTFKSLELLEIAESQGLVLQRIAPTEIQTREEKKSFFPTNKNGGKNEKSSGIQAYTISYRADSFMASVRQQLKTQPAPMPGQTSAPLQLNQPMKFDFNLNVQDRQVPYQVTVTYRQDPQNAEGITAEVVCEPREDLGAKAKANDYHFTLAIPSQGRNSLILQLDLGEFPVENSGTRKDISYAMRGNRMKKEVVVVLNPFQSVSKLPKNGLSAQAVREIIRQQEVLARKFYGSMDQGERENSKHCFAIAQRLRMSLGEMGNQSF